MGCLVCLGLAIASYALADCKVQFKLNILNEPRSLVYFSVKLSLDIILFNDKEQRAWQYEIKQSFVEGEIDMT